MNIRLFLFLMSVIISVEAIDISSLQENHLMGRIIKNEGYCVKGYEENRIFLDPSKISFTDEGPILQLNESETVSLPLVQINSNGFFIEHGFSDQNLEKKQVKIRRCCACFEPVDNRGRCQNPVCLFYGLVVDTVDDDNGNYGEIKIEQGSEGGSLSISGGHKEGDQNKQ